MDSPTGRNPTEPEVPYGLKVNRYAANYLVQSENFNPRDFTPSNPVLPNYVYSRLELKMIANLYSKFLSIKGIPWYKKAILWVLFRLGLKKWIFRKMYGG